MIFLWGKKKHHGNNKAIFFLPGSWTSLEGSLRNSKAHFPGWTLILPRNSRQSSMQVTSCFWFSGDFDSVWPFEVLHPGTSAVLSKWDGWMTYCKVGMSLPLTGGGPAPQHNAPTMPQGCSAEPAASLLKDDSDLGGLVCGLLCLFVGSSVRPVCLNSSGTFEPLVFSSSFAAVFEILLHFVVPACFALLSLKLSQYVRSAWTSVSVVWALPFS